VVPQNQMNAHILIVQPQCSPQARPVLSKYFTSAKIYEFANATFIGQRQCLKMYNEGSHGFGVWGRKGVALDQTT